MNVPGLPNKLPPRRVIIGAVCVAGVLGGGALLLGQGGGKGDRNTHGPDRDAAADAVPTPVAPPPPPPPPPARYGATPNPTAIDLNVLRDRLGQNVSAPVIVTNSGELPIDFDILVGGDRITVDRTECAGVAPNGNCRVIVGIALPSPESADARQEVKIRGSIIVIARNTPLRPMTVPVAITVPAPPAPQATVQGPDVGALIASLRQQDRGETVRATEPPPSKPADNEIVTRNGSPGTGADGLAGRGARLASKAASKLGSGDPFAPDDKLDIGYGAAYPKRVASMPLAHDVASRLIMTTTFIPIVLDTGIDSQRPGVVRAHVDEDVYGETGDVIVLPRGSKVSGTYESLAKNGETRVNVTWKRIVRPDLSQVVINSPAADRMGRTGIPGLVDNRTWEKYGAALLLTALSAVSAGAAAAASSGLTVTQIGGAAGAALSNVQTSPLSAAVSGGVSDANRNFSDLITQTIKDNLDVRPVIQVPPATPVLITLTSDLYFPPPNQDGVAELADPEGADTDQVPELGPPPAGRSAAAGAARSAGRQVQTGTQPSYAASGQGNGDPVQPGQGAGQQVGYVPTNYGPVNGTGYPGSAAAVATAPAPREAIDIPPPPAPASAGTATDPRVR